MSPVNVNTGVWDLALFTFFIETANAKFLPLSLILTSHRGGVFWVGPWDNQIQIWKVLCLKSERFELQVKAQGEFHAHIKRMGTEPLATLADCNGGQRSMQHHMVLPNLSMLFCLF